MLLLTTPKAPMGRLKPNRRLLVAAPYCSALLGGILGVGWFILAVGPSVLKPTYLGWLMQGDGAQHVLGWLFFRHEQWSLPLGAVPSFPYPVGTTVGYTDSIPWLALPAKILSPFLPADFQYVGAWLGLCFFLQGWFGVKIVQEFSSNPLVQLLGGACFILAPVLIWRIEHDSLCAHWLILGLIWLHVRSWPEGRTPRRALVITLGFCLISAGIHPVLATMVLALGLALLCKFHWIDRTLSTRQMAVWGGVFVAATLGVFSTLGYIGSGISRGANGFGQYSADLLTLVNPAGTSRFLPALPVAPGQYEGFGYVGSGVLVLGAIGLGMICYDPHVVRSRSLKPWLPLAICSTLFAAFALSSTLTLAGRPILTLDHFYQPIIAMVAPFRTSGRFIWPLHYLWITAIVWLWIAYFRSSQSVVYIVFFAIVTFQIVDSREPFLRWYGDRHERGQPFALQVEDLKYAVGLYKHMVLYPPQILGGTLPGCVMPGFDQDYYVPLAYQAYRLQLTFNSGYFSRIDEHKGRKYCQELHEQVKAGQFAHDTVYVVHNQYWDLIKPHISKIVCGRLSGYITCVSSQRDDAVSDFLRQHTVE